MAIHGTRRRAGVAGTVLGALLLAVPLSAQDLPWMLIVHGNVTTSSQLYPSINAVDPVVRSQSYEVNASYGYGGELRFRLPEGNIALALTVDHYEASLQRPLVTTEGETIPVDDGYAVTPVELTGFFIIPFSGKVFGVFMGAGAGIYPGKRRLAIGNTASDAQATSPGWGIQVEAGVSYSPLPRLSVLGEMKFRDVQFKATNAFPGPTISYHGRTLAVSQENDARVYTDGVIFQLGIGFSF
jgi:hypothetical protein